MTEQKWINCGAVLALAVGLAAVPLGCVSTPSGNVVGQSAGNGHASVGNPLDDDSLDAEKVVTANGPQIVLTVHPPGETVATRGALSKHRVFVTFTPQNSHDTVTVERVSPPSEKKKRFKVVLSTPPPATNTTGPHPIAFTIEPGKKQ